MILKMIWTAFLCIAFPIVSFLRAYAYRKEKTALAQESFFAGLLGLLYITMGLMTMKFVSGHSPVVCVLATILLFAFCLGYVGCMFWNAKVGIKLRGEKPV